jgi:hypothetical protein
MTDTLDRAIQQINLPDLLNEFCPTLACPESVVA